MPLAVPIAIAAAGAMGAGASAYGANKSSTAGKKAQQAQQDLYNQNSARSIEAGKLASERINAAGQQTSDETARLGGYNAKAGTPGETLLSDQGPVSQAVAQRILERTKSPGMDYDANSAALAQGVGEPLWRTLKQRGIAPAPGTEGGGLGTQQYMKGAMPALAELRGNQINTDISRGQQYGQSAVQQQNYYTNLASVLAEAIRGRQFQSGVLGAEAEMSGVNAASGASTPLSAMYNTTSANAQTNEDAYNAAMWSALLNTVSSLGTQAATKAPTTTSTVSSTTPYDRALQSRYDSVNWGKPISSAKPYS